MRSSVWAVAALCSAALAGCSNQATHKPTLAASAGCSQLGDTSATLATVYGPNQVHAAEKVERTEFLARAIQPVRTVGAEIHTYAAPGVTPEYLQRTLSCHAAAGKPAHANDPLHPSSGQIAELNVRSTGAGFAVQIIGDSPRTGHEIWQRARALSAPGSSVTVDQVASSAGVTETF